MEKVIVIVGPTASGKTKLSIELAKKMNGEIVSADSMQIYKYMDIGTAKPTEEEKEGIRHYLIDEVNPDEEFSVAKYQEMALEYIQQILEGGKFPIVAGGTGLYINSLLYNINFSETTVDWEYREELKKLAEENGNQFLHDRLKEVDPEAASRIHSNDIKRVIRALEVFKFTNKPISHHQELSRMIPPKYEFILIGLTMDRQKLYERINLRVDLMLENGLLQEIRKLIEMGYDKYSVAMQGIGYKELLAYLRGEMSYEEAVEIIKRESRRYAKRQLTWFRRLENIHWINLDEFSQTSEVLKNIENHIATHGIFL
ncbi:MAG: tRNA (adenosine(37)-N6)-dimethylallyltransferase MiaA [Clostridia bacterium]|nr:tRNA (adenosine(37)-N6)-dimethylallyltransferase MiaA [Clostridia bacterium]